MQTSKTSDIDLSTLNRLIELFQQLDWGIGDELFPQFCALFAALSPEEQDLVLAITPDFFHCTLAKYEYATRLAIKNMDLKGIAPGSRVIAVPLIKPKDVGKVKSGAFALYLFRNEFSDVARAHNLQFVQYDRPELLASKQARRRNAVVVMVDDFLGSGQTVTEALQDYEARLKVPSDQVWVVALVAQRQAVSAVQKQGASCAIGHVRDRGISDSTRLQDRKTALAVMDSIEERLGVHPDNRRGYHASEALVCMARCPNNTFPVFWHNKDARGAPWPAPFKR